MGVKLRDYSHGPWTYAAHHGENEGGDGGWCILLVVTFESTVYTKIRYSM
jgi:hypothetical protein